MKISVISVIRSAKVCLYFIDWNERQLCRWLRVGRAQCARDEHVAAAYMSGAPFRPIVCARSATFLFRSTCHLSFIFFSDKEKLPT